MGFWILMFLNWPFYLTCFCFFSGKVFCLLSWHCMLLCHHLRKYVFFLISSFETRMKKHRSCLSWCVRADAVVMFNKSSQVAVMHGLLKLRECLSNRPQRRVNHTPFLSLSRDISLIDNLCGKRIVLRLAVHKVITIYGCKRAGHQAAHSTG